MSDDQRRTVECESKHVTGAGMFLTAVAISYGTIMLIMLLGSMILACGVLT